MSISEKLTKIAENEQKVYEAGYTDGKAEGGGSATWETIVDITTTEEVNSIFATTEEFPNLAKCKEFVARAIYPKAETSSISDLGAAYLRFNNNTQAIYRFGSTKQSTGIAEHKCQFFIANRLICAIGTHNLTGVGSVVGEIKMLVGDRFINSISDISYALNEKTALMPIGTRLVIYGKVGG